MSFKHKPITQKVLPGTMQRKIYARIPHAQGGRIDIYTPIPECPVQKCMDCGNDSFVHAVERRKVSGLVNSTGKDQNVDFGILVCSKCGKKLEAEPPKNIID